MQNHLLKGMGMLYGIKKTQPVFQLWMKGIFDSFLVLKEMLHSRGSNGWALLGTQLHHSCSEETSTKQKATYAALGPICILLLISAISGWGVCTMQKQRDGESRVVPSCRDGPGFIWDAPISLCLKGVWSGEKPTTVPQKRLERPLCF